MKKVSMQEMNRQQELIDEQYAKEAQAMAPAVPYVVGVASFGIIGLLLPAVTAIPFIPSVIASLVVGAVLTKSLNSSRKKAAVILSERPEEKCFADEIAVKIDEISKELKGKNSKIKAAAVKESVSSMAVTLENIADEVERDPKDRNKVRKLANHYGSMLTELCDKYIALQDKAEHTEGENVSGSLKMLEKSFQDADLSLKKMLDGLFSDDAMEVTADINTIEALLTRDAGGEQALEMKSLEK